MIDKNFKGDLSQVSLPDILELLRTSRKTGVISFKRDRIRKSLFIQDGNVIFASSNLPEERLGDLLLTRGKIKREHYAKSVSELGKSKRQGRILVEMQAITPKQLWEGVQDQIRHIVHSLFNWDRGIFYFSQGDLPSHENITADVSISELILDGIRNMKDISAILRKFPSRDVILARIDYGARDRARLEPFERHVLELIDGKRSIEEICRDSEIGETETLKVLYMLMSIGYIKVKGKKAPPQPEPVGEEISSEEVKSVITDYNRMFSFLYRYMLREVGPITEHVLNKYLLEIRDNNSTILKNVILRKDGTLDENTLQGNLNWVRPDHKKEVLISSLNEFLYSAILAVKRTLGTEHESHVIETLKEIKPQI